MEWSRSEETVRDPVYPSESAEHQNDDGDPEDHVAQQGATGDTMQALYASDPTLLPLEVAGRRRSRRRSRSVNSQAGEWSGWSGPEFGSGPFRRRKRAQRIWSDLNFGSDYDISHVHRTPSELFRRYDQRERRKRRKRRRTSLDLEWDVEWSEESWSKGRVLIVDCLRQPEEEITDDDSSRSKST